MTFSKSEILHDLKQMFGDEILDHTFPKPYCKDKDKVASILLGCDPSNKHSTILPYAFAMESGLKIFNSFISSWERKLHSIGLSFENVYIQNLCQNYFAKETSENKIWNKAAEFWIPHFREELKNLPDTIPVLLTSEKLYKVLLNDHLARHKAVTFYNGETSPIIDKANNKLDRTLIVFYRHHSYNISLWSNYKKILTEYFEHLKVKLKI